MNYRHKQASKHIFSYKRRKYISSTDKAILKLIEYVGNQTGIDMDLKILDIGCGLGELLSLLDGKGYDVIGIDSDPKCIKVSNRKKKLAIKMDVINIEKRFNEDSFHIIIFSHSLEHFLNPLEIIAKVKKMGQFFIFAIPNPIRPFVIKESILRRNYSNYGHFCCWDRSHFKIFLERRCKLMIIKWEQDEVSFSNGFIGGGLRRIGFKFIEEKILTKILPNFSNSLIVLTQ